ncbi:MAG: prepilin-type N-terminal cleavage/methylation domain-containing protein [Candidatus Omnitrophica bacterium]|nr:prepilin-type N-terminal cleavage/methylation domain-containing protein [Candidatus Omnitrophota bacterium]
MAAQKGFTLIEILVAAIIVGVLAAIAIPFLTNYAEQTKAQAAKNNLLAIAAAQSKFYEDYNSYCISTGANPTGLTALCADNKNDINTNLHVSISPVNDPFTYVCTTAAAPFLCTATDNGVTLTTSGSVVTCTSGGNGCPS